MCHPPPMPGSEASCSSVVFRNYIFWMADGPQVRHSRAGGNPAYFQKLSRKNKTMDPRLRGGDEYLKLSINLRNLTLVTQSLRSEGNQSRMNLSDGRILQPLSLLSEVPGWLNDTGLLELLYLAALKMILSKSKERGNLFPRAPAIASVRLRLTDAHQRHSAN